jgi:CubicO group peptidase (beta-lactamase class C family)
MWLSAGGCALVLAVAAPGASPAVGAEAGVADAWREVEAFFRAGVEKNHIVGGSLLLVRDGRIAHHAVHGLADREARVPVTPDTIYHWASITKTFTGIAVLQLRDRGLLSLEDPAVVHLPELR